MTTLTVGGQVLMLMPEKCVLLPESDTLLVADLHIGKALSFRALGVPVPGGTTGETLALLASLVRRLAVRRGLGNVEPGRQRRRGDAVGAGLLKHAGERLENLHPPLARLGALAHRQHRLGRGRGGFGYGVGHGGRHRGENHSRIGIRRPCRSVPPPNQCDRIIVPNAWSVSISSNSAWGARPSRM